MCFGVARGETSIENLPLSSQFPSSFASTSYFVNPDIAMDGISAAASVLGILDVALRSAKFLHDLLLAVKDGPKDVERAVFALGQFQYALQQLSQCPAFSTAGSAPAVEYIKTCSDDVNRFADKLGKLVISDSDKRSGRIWKKVKIAFNEKTLAQVCDAIGHHTSSLLLQLSTYQRFYHAPNLGYCMIADTPDNSNVMHDSANRLTTIDGRLTEQVDIANNQNTVLSEITNDIAQLKVGCDSIQAMSSNQATQMLDMLRQLQDQVRSMSTPSQTAPEVVSPATDTVCSSYGVEEKEPARTEDEVLEAIERLCLLVGEKEDETESEDADELIEEIHRLTTHLKLLNSMEPLADDGAQTTWYGLERWSVKDFTKDIRTINGITSAAASILVNQPRKSRLAVYLWYLPSSIRFLIFVVKKLEPHFPTIHFEPVWSSRRDGREKCSNSNPEQ